MAVNLAWAVDRMLAALANKPPGTDPIGIARNEVTAIARLIVKGLDGRQHS